MGFSWGNGDFVVTLWLFDGIWWFLNGINGDVDLKG